MAKHARKVAAGLARRKAAYQDVMPESKQKCHLPGSQNRRKSGTGYKAGR